VVLVCVPAPSEISVDGTTPIESLQHDFGVIETSTSVSHSFTFKNPMDRAIRPATVLASCSCVSAFVEQDWVRPGESMDVKVVLRTPPSPSRLQQTLKVQFDDPELPPLELKVRATVKPELLVSTDGISIGYGVGEGAPSATFQVSNFGTQLWKSVEVEADADWVSARCEEERLRNADPESPLQQWMVSLNLNVADLPAGIHRAMLSVSTDPVSRSVELPVELNLVPRVVAFPGTWYSFASDGAALENSSKIVLRSGIPSSDCNLRCVASESLSEFLSLKLSKVDDSHRTESVYSLIGTWNRMPDTEIAGEVKVLWSDGPREHALTIPVLFVPTVH
jgi:hypothetical protein